jgi:excisionase family DNA binding protein
MLHKTSMKDNRKVRMGQKMLTMKQFAERLGMSEEWARKRVQRRQISFVRIGRSVRILESELDRLVQANLVPAQEERRAQAVAEAR